MTKFDKLYEEVMNDRIDEGIKEIWNNIFDKDVSKDIAKTFLLFAGNTTDSTIEKQRK